MDVQIEDSWKKRLAEEFEKPYFVQLTEFVRNEYRAGTCYPPGKLIFNAFNQCPFDEAKVVIIGQDPYHGPGQAHGLCFSVQKPVPAPPSLVNIYKELEADLGYPVPSHGCLESWAKNGVLLLNTSLTVRRGQPNSHKGKGWEILTDRIIEVLNEREKPMVFILWGNNAKAKEKLITNNHHLILKGAHPSPLGAHRGFWGGKYFSRTNAFLQQFGQSPVDWRIPE